MSHGEEYFGKSGEGSILTNVLTVVRSLYLQTEIIEAIILKSQLSPMVLIMEYIHAEMQKRSDLQLELTQEGVKTALTLLKICKKILYSINSC